MSRDHLPEAGARMPKSLDIDSLEPKNVRELAQRLIEADNIGGTELANYVDQFKCAITHELMEDPTQVQLVGGSVSRAYERSGIVSWMEAGGVTDPSTGCRIVGGPQPASDLKIKMSDDFGKIISRLVQQNEMDLAAEFLGKKAILNKLTSSHLRSLLKPLREKARSEEARGGGGAAAISPVQKMLGLVDRSLVEGAKLKIRNCARHREYEALLGDDIVNLTQLEPVLNRAVGRDPKIVSALIECGVNLDSPSKFGITPLMYYASNGDVADVKILLEYGANPENMLPFAATPEIAMILQRAEEEKRKAEASRGGAAAFGGRGEIGGGGGGGGVVGGDVAGARPSEVTELTAEVISRLRDNDPSLIETNLAYEKETNLVCEKRSVGEVTEVVLAQLLKKNTSLKSFTIYPETAAITAAFRVNRGVTSLFIDLEETTEKAPLIASLAEVIKENDVLTGLGFVGRGVDVTPIFEALKTNRTLEGIEFDRCDIMNKGAREFAETLKTNTAIKKLRLSDGYIGDEGARAIAKALEVNVGLTSFSFVSYEDDEVNKFGIAGATALYEALLQNPFITDCVIGKYETDSPEIDALCSRNRQMPQAVATKLDEYYNRIAGGDGAAMPALVLDPLEEKLLFRGNPSYSLQVLNLFLASHPDFDKETLRHIASSRVGRDLLDKATTAMQDPKVDESLKLHKSKIALFGDVSGREAAEVAGGSGGGGVALAAAPPTSEPREATVEVVEVERRGVKRKGPGGARN